MTEGADELIDAALRFYLAGVDPAGGFASLDAAGGWLAGPRPLYAAARMTYSYALGLASGRSWCAPVVTHGLAVLTGPFSDARHGGWFAALSAESAESGAPCDTRKQTYGHAFVLLAAAAAERAGVSGAAALRADAWEVLDRHLWDPDVGRCVEGWDEGWTTSEPYRGVNANMHSVEALLAVHAATGDPEPLRRARSICTWLVDQAAATDWRIPEHFDTAWRALPDYNLDHPQDGFRPYGSTPGHGIEWARLLLQLRLADSAESAESTESAGLLAAAGALFDRAVADGWRPARYGFAYTVDWSGTEVSAQRLHWPLAEAIAAVHFLVDATGEERYVRLRAALHGLADRSYVDRATGTWAHELDLTGTVSESIWPGRPDLYHALQATLFETVPPTADLTGALLALSRAG